MLIGMYKAWRLLDKDDDLYCAVLTGKGDTFCAGMDLKSGPGPGDDPEEIQRLMKDVPNLHWQALLRENLPNKPIILAIEGFAVAGGTEILQGTDIRVGAEDAKFGVTEVIRGLYPMAGSAFRLPPADPLLLRGGDPASGPPPHRPGGAAVWPHQPGGPQRQGRWKRR